MNVCVTNYFTCEYTMCVRVHILMVVQSQCASEIIQVSVRSLTLQPTRQTHQLL